MGETKKTRIYHIIKQTRLHCFVVCGLPNLPYLSKRGLRLMIFVPYFFYIYCFYFFFFLLLFKVVLRPLSFDYLSSRVISFDIGSRIYLSIDVLYRKERKKKNQNKREVCGSFQILYLRVPQPYNHHFKRLLFLLPTFTDPRV